MAYFGRVRAQAGLGREPFTADVAVERSVFRTLDLRVVVAQMLLQIRQLDKGPSALGQMTLVRTFT